MSTTISKKQVTVYTVVFKEMGIISDISVETWRGYADSTSLKITINGDHINGSHVFSVGDVKKFIQDLNYDYFLNKIDKENLIESDFSQWELNIKTYIAETRKEYPEYHTREEARKAWDSTTRIFSDHLNSEDLFFRELMDIEMFEDFMEIPDIPKKYTSKSLMWWENIWLPFVDSYAKEPNAGEVK